MRPGFRGLEQKQREKQAGQALSASRLEKPRDHLPSALSWAAPFFPRIAFTGCFDTAERKAPSYKLLSHDRTWMSPLPYYGLGTAIRPSRFLLRFQPRRGERQRHKHEWAEKRMTTSLNPKRTIKQDGRQCTLGSRWISSYPGVRVNKLLGSGKASWRKDSKSSLNLSCVLLSVLQISSVPFLVPWLSWLNPSAFPPPVQLWDPRKASGRPPTASHMLPCYL